MKKIKNEQTTEEVNDNKVDNLLVNGEGNDTAVSSEENSVREFNENIVPGEPLGEGELG